MAIRHELICSSHTISGVLPGGPVPSRHRFEDRIAACASAGYTGMCLHFKDYRALRSAGYGDERLREILLDRGMEDISLEFLGDWFLEGEAGEQARLDEATAYDAARAYGAQSLNVGSDFQERRIPHRTMRARFRALCNRAGEHGLKVALEIVPWSDVRDVDTALSMIDGIGNAGLVIDSWHIFRGGIALAELERIPGDRILSIQVNDADARVRGTLAEDTMHRKPCGEGVFDLEGFIASLERTGASVPLSVEIISPEFAALDLTRACELSWAGARQLIDRLGSG